MNKRIEKAKVTFKEKARLIHGDKYDYSEVEYVKSSIKVKIRCNICNTEFWQTPNNHLNGQGCPKCNVLENHKKQLKPQSQFLKEVKQIHGDKYDYSKVEYLGRNIPILIKCNECGKIFKIRPCQHLRGQGCLYCHRIMSKGERKIAKLLKKYKVEYITQKRFEDCKDKHCLPFDFYLPDYDICIEYQGKQHYSLSTLFDKTAKSFEERQKRDQIKREYCKNHNIKLIEIRYDENIEEKLELEILNKII